MSGPTDDAMTAMSRYLVSDTMHDTLSRVCDQALRSITPATMAGITMSVDAKPGTHVFTHQDVPAIDRVQYETGDGPCVEAFCTGAVVYVRSTDEPGSFPAFTAVAAGFGVGSVLAVPMNTEAVTVGALNLYGAEREAFGDADVAVATEFAIQAAYVLANARSYWDARTLGENLSQAMASRAEIEQAKGVLMSATGMSAEEAFDELRRRSQCENVKLRDLAHQIVQGAGRRRS